MNAEQRAVFQGIVYYYRENQVLCRYQATLKEAVAPALLQQALDAAKEVKRWGDPVVLPKMNSHDRRIIHITLQEDGEVETQSEGDGAFKKVVISPKKAEN